MMPVNTQDPKYGYKPAIFRPYSCHPASTFFWFFLGQGLFNKKSAIISSDTFLTRQNKTILNTSPFLVQPASFF